MPWVHHPSEVYHKRFHLNCNGGCLDEEYEASIIIGLDGRLTLYLPEPTDFDYYRSIESINHYLTQLDLEPIRKEDLEVEDPQKFKRFGE